MSAKRPLKLNIIDKNRKKKIPQALADEWVGIDNRVQENRINSLPDIKKPLESRFTIVIPTDLHKSIKKRCAIEGVSLKKKISQILSDEFYER